MIEVLCIFSLNRQGSPWYTPGFQLIPSPVQKLKRESGWEKKCPQANIRKIVEAEVEFDDIEAGGRQQAKQLVWVIQVAVGEVKRGGGGQEAGKTQLIVVQQH